MKKKISVKQRLLAAFIVVIFAVLALIGFRYEKEQALLSSVADNEEYEDLIYGADDSAPPLRFVDTDGIYKGVVVDYMNQISLELGIEIRCMPYKWEDALEALDKGETDFCDMFISPSRSEKYVFTDPIYILRTVIAVENGADYSLSDINHLRIATQKGDYANEYLKEHYPAAELIYVHDVGEGLSFLAESKVDAVIGDEPVLYYYADKKNLKDKIKMINTALYEEEVVIAMSKKNQDLVEPFNIAIKNMKSAGQLEKIQQKWFGISTPLIRTEDNTKKLIYLLIALLVICLIAIFKQVETRFLKRVVKERTFELEENRNELNLIFNEMPEAVIITDSSLRIVNCNKVAEGLLGESERLIGKKYCDCLKTFCGGCEKCPVSEVLSGSGEVMRKVQAEGKIYEIRVFRIESPADKQMAMITIKNITEEEIRNKHLLQTSKMIAVGQLAAGMAHQIRNPLGIIRTHSYIIRQQTDSEQILKSLAYIDESVRRSGRIVDNVMNFWRISDIKGGRFSVKQLITGIVDLEMSGIKKKQIQMDISCDENLIFSTNQESLKHILINLIQNAADAVSGPLGKIFISARLDEADMLEIRCNDNGCGIKEEDMGNLFNPFFTTKDPGKGTGLGLYIVYSEVENLGGTIEVESKEGKGACFTVKLPKMGGEEEDYEEPVQNSDC
ncbi:MAG: transporter substrate-binding domain-containing protein [Emergencia sp.]|nr:transporter substrate-binding domain-containing protein [Emergencia sp.]